QARKLEVLGRLAGAVAHDLNNLITVMLGYSELAQHQLADRDPIRADLGAIQAAGDRAAALTRQLLAYCRRQESSYTRLDLNARVTSLLPLLRRLIREDIDVLARLRTGIGAVRGDAGQLEQALLNLATNARDAMPEGGTLLIRTGTCAIAEADARSGRPAGRY